MNTGKTLLYTGLFISILIHGLVFTLFSSMRHIKEPVAIKKTSLLVPVIAGKPEKKQIPEPLPKKKKPPKKKVLTKPSTKKITKKINKKPAPPPLPVSHKRTLDEPPSKVEDVKPVFGVSKKTVTHADTTGMAVRVGNTLMKEQEEEFTPPEEVKDYVTVPVFDLTTLPEFKKKLHRIILNLLKMTTSKGKWPSP